MTALTIFYDGTCPLCAKEMAALAKHAPHHGGFGLSCAKWTRSHQSGLVA